jgi:hypothetical protein
MAGSELGDSTHGYVLAQQVPQLGQNAKAQEPPSHSGRSSEETYLSIGVLTFGILLLGLEVLVILKKSQGWGINSTRIVGLTLIVTSGVFLITAGYSKDQTAPMVGLLGTIAEYLLGKTGKNE